MPGHRHPIARTLAAVGLCVALLGAILLVRNLVVDDPLDRLAVTPAASGPDRVWQGSWHFPRGGPYILGFESYAGPAALFIDDTRVASGAGRVSARVVHEPGVKSVRFEAPPGARLLWHPPGRRGPLEYVPPSSLSPDPPAAARFGRWAGAAPLDGLFAALAVLVLIALGLYLARGALARVDRRTAAWGLVIFAGALAVRLCDLGGAGQTWDEDVNWSAGKNYITNLLSLDFSPPSWEWNYEHPPVMKYVAGLGAQWADGYGPARALSALLVAIACALLVPIGKRLYSLRVGALAGAVAALTPHLIAHGKIVGHEAPTLLLWALGIWLALCAHARADHRTWLGLPRRVVLFMLGLGVILGLAVFSRFVNALLGPLLVAILVIQAPAGQRARTFTLAAVILPLVALAVGVAIWPRLWTQPITHLQMAWLKLRKPHAPEPFLGAITNTPPRVYFVVYLAATAPLGVLAGVAAFFARARVRRRAWQSTAVILAWLTIPLVVALSPVRQDGVRYVMPCLLALSLMCAAGVDALAGLASRALGRVPALAFAHARARATAALGLILGAYLAVVSARIHPYYLDYYGEHVGGPAGVAARKWFEVAWWGEGIHAAVDHVNRHAAPGARVHKACVEPSHLTWLRADLWPREVRSAAHADWIIVYQPSWRRCPVPDQARVVYEVRAQGAPLARVYHVTR